MRFKFIFFILFFILSKLCHSQFSKEDSLFRKITTTKDSAIKMRAYLQLLQIYDASENTQKQLYVSQRALKLSRDGNDSVHISEALEGMANAFSGLGAHNTSINFFLEALQICEKLNNKREVAQIQGRLGVMYTRVGEMDKAEFYLTQNLEYYLKRNDKNACAGTYNNLGILYRNLKKYGDAIAYYRESIQICEENGDEHTLMQIYNNIAYLHALLGDTAKALEDYDKSYALAVKLKDKFQQGLVLENLGLTYNGLRQIDKALDYLQKGLIISKEVNDLIGIVEIHGTLSLWYDSLGQSKKALFHYKAYINSKDTLEKINNEKERQRTEIKHEYEKEKLSILKDQEKRDLVTKAVSKKQQQIIYSVTISLILVAILLVFLYQRFKITKAQKSIIEDQKKIVDIKQKEILDSINYAKRIQDSLLDKIDPGNKFFADSFILFKPKDIVSGDFYWHSKKLITEKINAEESFVRELFFVAVCDSTGHGVPGGFMSLLNIAYISEAVNEKNIIEPNKAFDHVRNKLISTISKNDQKDGFDGVLMCIEKKSHFKNKILTNTSLKLDYAAAFNAPLIVRNNQILNLETNKMPVGSGELKNNFTLFTFELQKDDIIYVYTDGFGDQFGGPKGKKFMYRQLNEILLELSNNNLNNQKEELTNRFDLWKGDLEQVDDVLLVGIKI